MDDSKDDSKEVAETKTKQGNQSSDDVGRERKRDSKRPQFNQDYSDQDPPIQFAIFLLVLAVLLTIFTLFINHARTSGWFDNLGRS